ncbi:MAG: FAD-dependent oxidoreductase, partial [Oscillospiraceae bacterium]
CVIGVNGTPFSFFEFELYISGFYIDTYQVEEMQKNGCKVAVIGAGPAGITMSIILSLRGFSVSLIESKDKIGGVLRFGIPEFRLPKNIIDKYDDILHKLGVKFKPNTFIGSTLTIEDMFIDGYDAVFISVGTSRPNRLGMLGETLGNVHYAIDYLKSPDAYHLGKDVVVVGAGNVAIDAARMAVRKIGSGKVIILNNRRECDMTSNLYETEMAKIDGVKFIHQMQAIKLEEDGVLCANVSAVENNGEIIYEEDFTNTTKISADTIIVAIGQGPQAAVISDTKHITQTSSGLFEVDENGHTAREGVFAAGDIVTGPKTVVDAVAFTKKVADEIEKYCKRHCV